MKRAFFITSLVFMAINIMANQPIFVEGRVWTALWYGGATGNDSIDNLPPTTEYYKVEGDTIINETTYKKIFHSDDLQKEWHLYRLMREDNENTKVWVYTNRNIDVLEMDFTLNAGDIFDAGWMECTGIGQTKDREGNILKVLEFDYHYYLIEGYGWTSVPLDGAGFNITSVSDENGILMDFSQKPKIYRPIIVEGYSWNIVNRKAHLDGNNTVMYTTLTEKIEGDSVVNGVTYKKLWRSTDTEMTKFNIIALVREDIENKKVWTLVGEKEYLIYDFACQVGDKVTTLKSIQSAEIGAEEVELTINAIDTVEDFRLGKFKKYIATIEGYEDEYVYYERYGAESGWYARPYDESAGGGINFMICAFDAKGDNDFKLTHGDEVIDNIRKCYINETKTDIDNVEIQKASLKKVMHDGQLYIIHEGKTYNVMGVEVENMNFDL